MKRTIVLLHGWGADSSRYELLSRKLQGYGYDPLALDMPGFGKEKSPKRVCKISDYVSWLNDEIEHRELKQIILLGHSFGGQVAVAFTHQYPQKVSHLILVSPAAVRLERTLPQRLFYRAIKAGKFVLSLPGLNRLYELARWSLYRILRQADYYKADEVMRKTMSNVLKEDLRSLFTQITTPTLLVWGTDDMFTPYELHTEYTSRFPDITLKTFDGEGHTFFYTDTEELASDIDSFVISKT